MVKHSLEIPYSKAQQKARNGYNDQIVNVDLSTGDIWVENPGDDFYRRFLGGRAFVCHHLLKEVPRGVDPLGPENRLIFATGVVTGTSLLGSGRHGVGGKSPLTGALGSSEAGGWWGAELKRAGFDGLVIRGKSETPVFLYIHSGIVEIRDAKHLWGRLVADVERQIRAELGDEHIRVAQIGPAGERLIRYACIMHDRSRAAGRTGMGALMGSKMLKAIAVRGSTSPGVADKERVAQVNKWFSENYKIRPRSCFHLKAGTGGGIEALNEMGGLPVRNFQDPQFSHAGQISNANWLDRVIVGRDTCHACPVHCKVVAELDGEKDGFVVDRSYGGPEYETLAAFGSNVGVDNYKAIVKANEICNSNGMDTISAGATIAFVMECVEKGILTQQELDGLDLRFGNAAGMLEALEMIINRRDFGDRMAEGSARLAKEIGRGAEQFAMHVKGQELPMHDTRNKFMLGVGYGLSPTGADHNHNLFDTGIASKGHDLENISIFDEFEPMSPYVLDDQKLRAYYYLSNYKHALDCAVMCMFPPYHYSHIAEAVRGVTGWEVDETYILEIGQRAATMSRIFNIREGFTEKDDAMPPRLHMAFSEGPSAGKAPTPEEAKDARHKYYEMMGWDRETGRPTPDGLRRIGLGDYVEII